MNASDVIQSWEQSNQFTSQNFTQSQKQEILSAMWDLLYMIDQGTVTNDFHNPRDGHGAGLG